MRRLLPLVIALAGACGDDGGGTDPPSGDILAQLRAQPEIASVLENDTDWPGYRYFELQVRQPIDHANPGGGEFEQYATLIHRDPAAPVVMLHTGYGNWYYDYPGELTRLLHANQIVVEHRFFRGSRPDNGAADWQHLTIEQSAADHHRIVEVLRRLYPGSFLETGASKGGMTSVYHRRFYPDDLDGTVAYVAPISFAAPDYRYEPFLEQLGPAPCRAALRALQRELLARRAMLEERATQQALALGLSYTRVAIPAAVESAVVSVEWSFWQYVGGQACSAIPPTTAIDDALWAFLEDVSAVSSASDGDLAEFEAYYHQAEHQLGYPGTMDDHLTDLLIYGPSDYEGVYPRGVPRPAYTPQPMADIDAWVKTDGERLLFLYGEWDPWTGGAFELGGAADSLKVVAPMAPHGADLVNLAEGDRAAALAKLEAWTGVTPDTNVWMARRAPPPRMPRPMFVRRR